MAPREHDADSQSHSADEVRGAVKKLESASNYSWKVRSDPPSGFLDAKTERGGYTMIANPWYAIVKKGDEAAISAKQQGMVNRWRTMAEASGGGSGRVTNLSRVAGFVQRFKYPTERAVEFLEMSSGLQPSDDTPLTRKSPATPPPTGSSERASVPSPAPSERPTNPRAPLGLANSEPQSSATTQPSESFGIYSAKLTEAGARALLVQAAGGPESKPEIFKPQGRVKFWIKDGVLCKFSYHIQGLIISKARHGDGECNETVTIEITDIGTTKVDVPADAIAKLSPISASR